MVGGTSPDGSGSVRVGSGCTSLDGLESGCMVTGCTSLDGGGSGSEPLLWRTPGIPVIQLNTVIGERT